MARGSKPGERRGGRKKGTRNKATVEQRGSITEMARAHTDTALGALVSVASSSDSDAARVSAAMGLLGYGYGKPTQPHEGTDRALIVEIIQFATHTGAPQLDAPALSNGGLAGMGNGHQAAVAHLAPAGRKG